MPDVTLPADLDALFPDERLEPAPLYASDLGPALRTTTGPDWALAAYMLAGGARVAEVAQRLNVSRTTVWRRLKGSSALRARVVEERRCLEIEARSRMGSLRSLVVSRLEEAVARGDVRVALWLADRLGLAADDFAPSQGGSDVYDARG